MGDVREFNQNPPSPDDSEDDSGLELSLGLSCGGSVSKVKGKEPGSNGGGKENLKNGKTGVKNAFLKHFLENSHGEEEDIGKQKAGTLPLQQESFRISLEKSTLEEPQKSTGMHTSQLLFPGFGDTWCAAKNSELPKASPQEILSNFSSQNSHGETPGTPVRKGDINIMSRELQFPPHAAAGQFMQNNLPAHFLDAFGKGSLMSGQAIGQSHAIPNSLTQHSTQIVGTQSPSLGMKASLRLDITQDKQFIGMENANTDQQQRKSVVQQHQRDDILEHQKKEEMREARKKRKMLIEEQKQQKKTKKEDERAGPHGFRRPGSNTWVRGWEMATPSLADMDRSKITQEDHDEANQAMDVSFNLQRERDKNMKESETDTDKEESSESQQEESNDSDNSFLQGLKAREIGKSFSNAKQLGYLPNENYKYSSEAQQCTSKGTDALQKKENAEEQDCKIQSPVGVGKLVPQSNMVGNNSNTVLSSVPITNSATITSTALHYPLQSFSVLPAPYSLPIPVPNNPNVPFPVGFSFPYLMHYIPPSVDCLDRTGARPPIYPSGFQLPPGYTPFQLPTPEASPSWVPVMRPQQSPTFYPANFGGARTSSESVEDETKVSQGVKRHDQQRKQVSLTTEDTFKHTISSLHRSDSLRNSQEEDTAPTHLLPVLGPQVLSSLSFSSGSSLAQPQTLSGTGKTQFFTEHGRVSAVRDSGDSISIGSATRECKKAVSIKSPRKDEAELKGNVNGSGIASEAVQKDEGHAIGGPYMTSCLSQEVTALHPGLACGLKFGGNGTTPELPWVSTTGRGGKKICGVLYRYNANQVNVVCACHGRHMSSNEFVQHANIVGASNPQMKNAVNPYTVDSPAASAQG